ncbi:protein phosphatases PP1 regulatory subunit sds22 [Metarhizium rileyi]|uniref:Protein phosphatases PP1 regulatory subunit sds22 n=1 Tax=Metarhizium rileyi (strain RCEF 4871) TaxID=1649241 RepID=A0A166VW54_METRR|nr:protein phosphatases PP1 regulatory subunit sds22 [Metarhizium rileyi RCEF 4871]
MSSAPEKEADQPHHIDFQDDRVAPREDGDVSRGMRNSKGWDGKLRVPKSALLSNPGALSDPEYSDDSNVLPGEEIEADEDLLESESSDTEEVMCSHARIGSISSLRLERFKSVARICLRQNSIQEIEGLAPLAATLKDLDLYDNLISHMRGMDELKNIVSLDLSFNKIKHIKNISHMTKLKELFLVANKISKIEGLDTFQNLKSLELGSNRIRELRNLDKLESLEELWVAKNKITELTGLGGLRSLRLLSIQSNRIKDLSPLKEVPHLEELYIAHNALESLEGIEGSTGLTILDISNNQIRNLKGLEGLAKLEEVWASYNQIGDFVEVENVLRDKENLTTHSSEYKLVLLPIKGQNNQQGVPGVFMTAHGRNE